MSQFPAHPNREFFLSYRELNRAIRELSARIREPRSARYLGRIPARRRSTRLPTHPYWGALQLLAAQPAKSKFAGHIRCAIIRAVDRVATCRIVPAKIFLGVVAPRVPPAPVLHLNQENDQLQIGRMGTRHLGA
jgi:hypothetical protein